MKCVFDGLPCYKEMFPTAERCPVLIKQDCSDVPTETLRKCPLIPEEWFKLYRASEGEK